MVTLKYHVKKLITGQKKRLCGTYFVFLLHANCLYCVIRMTFFHRNDRERKFLVYEGQLMDLFGNCPSCAQPIYGEIQQIKGSFITITQDCGFCAFQRTWSSQPFIGSIPAGNFELSCALLFSGSLPSKATRMFQFLNMASISYRTFMYHQQCYLHPVVIEV